MSDQGERQEITGDDQMKEAAEAPPETKVEAAVEVGVEEAPAKEEEAAPAGGEARTGPERNKKR